MSYRNHVANDTAIQLDDFILVQLLIRHMCAVDESQLHEGCDQKLINVARHSFRFVFLPQDLINLITKIPSCSFQAL